MLRQCREAHSDVEPQPQSFLSCNEQLLHTVSLSCLDGNYLLFNFKINYIVINRQFTHWGNAYTCFNIIPCQKVDGASSICQTNFIILPSLKVRLPTVCHEDQCVESSGRCWLVSSVFLGPAMYYLDDTGKKKHWEKHCIKTVTGHPNTDHPSKTAARQLKQFPVHFFLICCQTYTVHVVSVF